jgi:hypothetical protein
MTVRVPSRRPRADGHPRPSPTVLLTTAMLTVVVVLGAGCGPRGGQGSAGATAVGGRTCEGWVTVDAVEAATGLAIDDLDLHASPRDAQRIVCEYDDPDGTTVLKLYSERWEGGIWRDEIHLSENEQRRDGPIDGSVIAPIPEDEDDPAVMGLARFPRDPMDLGLGVVLYVPADDGDPDDHIGRLLEELWATAEDGAPDAT